MLVEGGVRNNTKRENALRIDVTGKRVTRIAPIFEEQGECYEQGALSIVGRWQVFLNGMRFGNKFPDYLQEFQRRGFK
jgi:hypothetical protein